VQLSRLPKVFHFPLGEPDLAVREHLDLRELKRPWCRPAQHSACLVVLGAVTGADVLPYLGSPSGDAAKVRALGPGVCWKFRV
jgi:hypothetical protein